MKSSSRILFAFVVLLIAVGCLCNGSNLIPVSAPATEPSSATDAPQASAAPEVGQPSSSQDFFTEEFDGDISSWTYFTSKNNESADDTNVQPIAENGFLIMDIGKNLNLYATYDPYTYSNVRLDVRVDNRGVNNNNINLICRYSDEGWYEASVANNGLYWIWAYDGAKGVYAKLADGGSNDIKAGKETNEYSFICNDRNLTLGINGNEIRTYTDNQYVFRDGKIGIGLSSFNDIPVKVEFDWVKISEP